MKKYVILFMTLCLSLLVFGCNTETENAEPDESAIVQTETPDVENIPEEEKEAEPQTPSDAEIDAVFDQAYEVYQWFELDKLEVESDANSTVMYEIDGNYYGKVTDNRASSFNDLSAAVHTYFSEDICEHLLNDGLYMEENGVLYELLADRGGDITHGDILSKDVNERTDTSIRYTVTVETYDPSIDAVTGSEEIQYLYEKIDGKWVFTQFQSIY